MTERSFSFFFDRGMSWRFSFFFFFAIFSEDDEAAEGFRLRPILHEEKKKEKKERKSEKES